MRIAVTGRNGQVARALAERATGHEVIRLGRPGFDLRDLATIAPAIRAARPDLVIAAAAFTAVDQAETEPRLAWAINAAAAGEVARATHALGLPLIHLSTDYVFDGLTDRPYLETDRPNPASVYGASKLAGERAVMAAHPDAVILRTAWVYSPFGANFIKTMLKLAAHRAEIGVVADQIGHPTSAFDLADGVLAMALSLARQPQGPRGLFHMTGQGQASWADLAEATLALSRARGGPHATVRRIGTHDYPATAPRPRDSRLACDALARGHGIALPPWRASLAGVVARLLHQKECA